MRLILWWQKDNSKCMVVIKWLILSSLLATTRPSPFTMAEYFVMHWPSKVSSEWVCESVRSNASWTVDRGAVGSVLDLLFEMTKYESCTVDGAHVKLFWQMNRERFNDADRSRLGRSRLLTSHWCNSRSSDLRMQNCAVIDGDSARHVPIGFAKRIKKKKRTKTKTILGTRIFSIIHSIEIDHPKCTLLLINI